MIALLQRVTKASVTIDGKVTAEIEAGMLALIGVKADDTTENVSRLANKMMQFRLFSDEQGRMNLDLQQAQKSLLVVPQFTLAADTRKGRRPGFSNAAPPELAEHLFDLLCRNLALRTSDQRNEQAKGLQKGTFGADMQVALINDGPVTFWIDS